MKKVTLTLLLATLASVGYGQGVRLGLKLGGSLTNAVGSDIVGSSLQVGGHGGITANVGITKNFSLQPEALFSMKGDQATSYGPSIRARLYYIDVPVVLKYTRDDVFFEAGPQGGYLLSYQDNTGFTTKTPTPFRTLDYGYVLGFGYQDPGGFSVGWRYNGGLTNVYRDVDFGDGVVTTKGRNNAIQLYIAYRFPALFGGKKAAVEEDTKKPAPK
ncbi:MULTISPECIES: porin family protein [Hymenobacter]|uniref:PorT family protein n=1 Tax=Hymenobacter jejuensis TaxID=2502781 RepID=A0A5B8A0L4_9BACT|nr:MULTISPECIES: porin family protein [Hymenobacter]MBC6992301.1 PorT family protein [Hymenobacter sp. BT491]QDA59662.1 PorT family protein [Hymenobacter jejuensis]